MFGKKILQKKFFGKIFGKKIFREKNFGKNFQKNFSEIKIFELELELESKRRE